MRAILSESYLDGLDATRSAVAKLPRSGATQLKIHGVGSGPFASGNTYSPTILTDHLVDTALTSAAGTFAPLGAFSSVRDPDAYKPLARDVVKFVTSGGTVQQNPTTFQTSTNVLAGTAVSMNHYSLSWSVSNADLNSGVRPGDLLEKNLQVFATSLVSQVTALMTTTNFSNPRVISAPGGFGLADMSAAYASIASSPQKFLLLDSQYFASLNASAAGGRGFQSGDAVFGFAGVFENSAAWSSAGANVRGFAGGKSAIILVCGNLVYGSTNDILQRRYLTLPCGLTVEHNLWIDLASRGYWQSLDCVLGASVADSGVGTLIASA